MENADQHGKLNEIDRLQAALALETQRGDELQRSLDRANTEFEEFVSLAAHNMRESLRDVAAFSQLIAETCSEHLDSDVGMFLDRIRAGAASAQSLLTDVVDYWAVDAGDRRTSRIDTEAVLCQALLSTEKQIAERSAVVTHDPLPAVMGDFGLLSKVLHHLIRNAIEYCATASPHVHISSRREHDGCVFSVRDNGPGIDTALQGQIFIVFKRLHGKEHPGNGLGLPFCRKAIDWHGGRIWVESATGTGSTFYFTLPPAA